MTTKPYHIHEQSLQGTGGTALYVERYRPLSGEPKATLVIVHGLGEHSGRYEHVAKYFVEKGYQVVCYDHQGHGRSSGTRAHVRSFRDYRNDLATVVQWADDAKHLPVFLLAHSMGALIALDFLGHHSTGKIIRAATLIGIPLKPHVEASPLTQMAGTLLSVVWPTLAFNNDVDPRYLARNEEVGRKYLSDPLVLRKVTAGWFVEFMRAIEQSTRDLQHLETPILFLHGGEDRIAHPDGSRVAFQAYPGEDKQLHIYEGCFHELLNEDDHLGILDEIREWFQRSLAASAPVTSIENPPRERQHNG